VALKAGLRGPCRAGRVILAMVKDERAKRKIPATRRPVTPSADHDKDVASLRRELAQAHQQQAATADVLKIISRSAFDLQTVLDTLVEAAARLCEAEIANLNRPKGEAWEMVSGYGHASDVLANVKKTPIPMGRASIVGRAVEEARIVHIRDVEADSEYTFKGASIAGYRTILGIPLLREGSPIGVLVLGRRSVRPFTETQIAMAATFADQAAIAIENVRLFHEIQARTKELTELLEQQTAASEVLQVISNSSGDLDPIFQALLENATRLCEAKFGSLALREGEAFRIVALHNAPPAYLEERRRNPLIRPHLTSGIGRIVTTKRVVHIDDLRAQQTYLEGDPAVAAVVDLGGARTIVLVPLLKNNDLVGVIAIYRQEVRPFTTKQITLLENFANQAVIAIENARLLTELRESLQQQTATADVLKVISRSAFDLQTVLNTLTESAARLCEAEMASLNRPKGDAWEMVSGYGHAPDVLKYMEKAPIPQGRGSVVGRTVIEGKIVHIHNVEADSEYTFKGAPIAGYRTMIGVPLMRDGGPIGVLVLGRRTVQPFTEKQIELVTTFADQAVIAIENVRLFDQVQARTSELQESLEYQTAISDVLDVISRSPSNIQPVLDTIIEVAQRLCQSEQAYILRLSSGVYHLAATKDAQIERIKYLRENPIAPNRSSVTGRVALERRTIHISDALADPEYTLSMSGDGGYRTILGVPLLREGVTLGVIVLTRGIVQPFTEKQIQLISSFADQAVIAIENARLFDEVQARTKDLTESLEQQTATSEVLQVISSSPGELEPVFETMLENAVRICGAKFGTLGLYDGDTFRNVALHNVPPAYADLRLREPFRPHPKSGLAHVAKTRQVAHTDDLRTQPPYLEGDPAVVAIADLAGARTILNVPMLKEGRLVGAISIFRQEVRPFTDKQIELVTNFAAQAVIAIENTRLLNELRESLQQQTATADVLKVISRSAFDLQTVLDTLVQSAARLCEADQGTIAREQHGAFRRVATHGFSAEFTQYVRNILVVPERGTATGRALLEGRIIHIPDVQADPDYTFAEAVKLGGFRTILSVPMLREGTAIGVLALTRHDVRPFTEKQIELVSTFADQAAIAIENVRLFESVEARTRELAKSLEELRTAQDRLVQTQKLASLGQLTAGIAHEIKNPLNFVNNFSAVSVELIQELREALQAGHFEGNKATEVAELADMLQGNLDKIIQHGKRADSIVKNMLLHSREGSGEHRPVDINAIVEESLNLAYHGARAEKQGFNITLERAFDPSAGQVDLYPQEVTRVFLNLISNGFYAAMKRKSEANDEAYEPTLTATTKNLGDRVEIVIRDNGTGIPPEMREKIFNPFFTTKPAGEGTGLGLSLSHDIVVKQHAGSIEVDSQPGEFTEFRIILPRAAASPGKSGEAQ